MGITYHNSKLLLKTITFKMLKKIGNKREMCDISYIQQLNSTNM